MIYSRSPGWQSPQEQKNVSPAPYPWRKLYSCKNKTCLGRTFPFPWSSGLSSLAALGRQLSCRSRKVKSCPSESLVLTWIHSFRGKVRGIYILSSRCHNIVEAFGTKMKFVIDLDAGDNKMFVPFSECSFNFGIHKKNQFFDAFWFWDNFLNISK